jgi:tartrate dehydratase alpha subunit/fumarate hydratase class I-like protein
MLQSRMDKMSALMQDSSISREDRHSKMMEIRHSSSAQIRSLLSEDQQKKYDAMEKEREQEMQRSGHGGMGGDH